MLWNLMETKRFKSPQFSSPIIHLNQKWKMAWQPAQRWKKTCRRSRDPSYWQTNQDFVICKKLVILPSKLTQKKWIPKSKSFLDQKVDQQRENKIWTKKWTLIFQTVRSLKQRTVRLSKASQALKNFKKISGASPKPEKPNFTKSLSLVTSWSRIMIKNRK